MTPSACLGTSVLSLFGFILADIGWYCSYFFFHFFSTGTSFFNVVFVLLNKLLWIVPSALRCLISRLFSDICTILLFVISIQIKVADALLNDRSLNYLTHQNHFFSWQFFWRHNVYLGFTYFTENPSNKTWTMLIKGKNIYMYLVWN